MEFFIKNEMKLMAKVTRKERRANLIPILRSFHFNSQFLHKSPNISEDVIVGV